MTRPPRARMRAVLVGLGLLLVLSGCWDQRPVETRAAVLAIGVDPGPRKGWLTVTFAFPNVTLTASGLASVPPSQQLFTKTVIAPTLTGALDAVQREESRALYLGQVRFVALSTHLPANVWDQTLHDLTQIGTLVLSFWVVATPSAAALTALHPATEVVPEVALYRSLACQCQAWRWPGRAWSVWADSVTPGVSAAVAEVRADSATNTFQLQTLAVWTPHGLVTWPALATAGWAYLTGRSLDQSLRFRDGSGQVVSIGRIHGTTTLHFSGGGGHVHLTTVMRLQGIIVGGGASAGSPSMESDLTATVRREVLRACDAAIREAFLSQSDPFGWHRDLGWRWGGLRAPATIGRASWHGWTVEARVRFQIRNEGVLR